MPYYKNKGVRVVRPWQKGDPGWNETDKKVLIAHGDFTPDEFVFAGEVSDKPIEHFHKGHKVVVVRTAQAGDTNYSTLPEGAKVLVTNPNGGHEVVLASEVEGYTIDPEVEKAQAAEVDANRPPEKDKKEKASSTRPKV